jgi:penicillin-binding protein 1A
MNSTGVNPPVHPNRLTTRQSQAIAFTFLSLVVVVVIFSFLTVDGLPSIEQLENPRPELATRVYSIDGELIDQYFIKNRTFIRYDSLPKALIDALVATEDRRFYDHWGISVAGIARALLVDVFTLSKRQGASTITQQLARNMYLTQEQTLLRKVREALTAVQIERTFTKKEILELYFNVSYFGRGAYGVQAASAVYFNKAASHLTLAECAQLVGMLKAPERYDPDRNAERARKRRVTVLENMVDAGAIDHTTAEPAKRDSLRSQPEEDALSTGPAPHFIEWIRQQVLRIPAIRKYDLYRDGLVIYTTLDSRMQRAANRATEEHLRELQPEFDKRWKWSQHPQLADKLVEAAVRTSAMVARTVGDAQRKHAIGNLHASKPFRDSVLRQAARVQVGFVAIDPSSGEIRAMVGGSNFREFRYGLNHVTQIQRQPGSSFKPFAYASAIMHGYTPETRIAATPYTYVMPDGKTWTPAVPDEERVEDTVSLRRALQMSVNSSAARVITQFTTPHDVARLAHEMGIHSTLPEYPSIALGSAEVTPLEITGAYGAFANNGIAAEPFGILRIEDGTGKIIYRGKPLLHDALDRAVAHTMTSMMQAVVDGGTGSNVRKYFALPAAGKTGTTQDFADAWFIGYTPELCAGTWVGFDDRRITFGGWYGQGGKAAAPLWARFMRYTYAEKGLRFKRLAFDGDSTRAEDPPTPAPVTPAPK